jgi:hypothetical protein
MGAIQGARSLIDKQERMNRGLHRGSSIHFMLVIVGTARFLEDTWTRDEL